MPVSDRDRIRTPRPRDTSGWPSVAEHLADHRRRLLDELVGREPDVRGPARPRPPGSRAAPA